MLLLKKKGYLKSDPPGLVKMSRILTLDSLSVAGYFPRAVVAGSTVRVKMVHYNWPAFATLIIVSITVSYSAVFSPLLKHFTYQS